VEIRPLANKPNRLSAQRRVALRRERPRRASSTLSGRDVSGGRGIAAAPGAVNRLLPRHGERKENRVFGKKPRRRRQWARSTRKRRRGIAAAGPGVPAHAPDRADDTGKLLALRQGGHRPPPPLKSPQKQMGWVIFGVFFRGLSPRLRIPPPCRGARAGMPSGLQAGRRGARCPFPAPKRGPGSIFPRAGSAADPGPRHPEPGGCRAGPSPPACPPFPGQKPIASHQGLITLITCEEPSPGEEKMPQRRTPPTPKTPPEETEVKTAAIRGKTLPLRPGEDRARRRREPACSPGYNSFQPRL